MNESERNVRTERDFRTTNVDDHCHRWKESLSWTGVMAGALLAVGWGFLLNIFYLGIGLTVVNNTEAGVTAVVIGGLIAAIIGSVVTMFAAAGFQVLLRAHIVSIAILGFYKGYPRGVWR